MYFLSLLSVTLRVENQDTACADFATTAKSEDCASDTSATAHYAAQNQTDPSDERTQGDAT